jgi:Kef-type K+ transport system membrane component KefB
VEDVVVELVLLLFFTGAFTSLEQLVKKLMQASIAIQVNIFFMVLVLKWRIFKINPVAFNKVA